MWTRSAYNWLARVALLLTLAAALTSCGGYVEVYEDDPPPITPLSLVLTRIGPEEIQLDWSDDPDVYEFVVRRDGYTLATVNAISLIDASVMIDQTYCYQVSGYDVAGYLIAQSATGCVTILP
jgi:hypothetical protein